MKVLVTGATGFVGRRLVPALVEAGHDVTVLVRDAVGYDPQPGVRVVQGDLSDTTDFGGAFEVDAAYYLVHSMDAGRDFEARDRLLARNFVAAADAAGVERVVYLGGLGEDRDQLSPHLRSRREVEHLLDGGSFALTTLRAGVILGADSASFELLRALASRLPVMVTPRWVETRCQPLAIDDVIAYLVGVLSVPETAGEMYEIGGPEVLSYRDLLVRVGRRLGHEPVIVPVPVLTPKLSAYWVDLVTDVPRSVAHALIEGLRNPVVVTDDRIRDLVPVELTPLDEAIDRALGGAVIPVEAQRA